MPPMVGGGFTMMNKYNSYQPHNFDKLDEEMHSSRSNSYSRSKSRNPKSRERGRSGSLDSRRSRGSPRDKRRSLSREYDGYNAKKQYGMGHQRFERDRRQNHQESSRNYSRGQIDRTDSRNDSRHYSSRPPYQKRDDKYNSKHDYNDMPIHQSYKRQRQNDNEQNSRSRDDQSFSSYESFNQSKKRRFDDERDHRS